MRRTVNFLIICMLTTIGSVAQIVDNNPYYRGFQSGHAIYHWTTSNGLPQSHIAGITQTRNKLIWIATYDGVIHFDGRKFAKTNSKYHNKETSSFVTAIQAKGDTLIWASTQEIVFYVNNRIVAVHPIKEQGIFIMAIRTYKEAYYFIAHDRIYCLKNGQLTTLVRTKDNPSLRGKTIHTATFLNNQIVYMVGNEKSATLHVYDLEKNTKRLVALKHPIDNLSVRNGQLLLQYTDQWFATNSRFQPSDAVYTTQLKPEGGRIQSSLFENDIVYYNRSSLVIDHGKHQQSVLDVADIISGNEIFASFVDHTGNLWVGTNSLGLFMFREYPFEFFNFPGQPLITNSSHAFIDNEGLLWFDNECNTTMGIDMNLLKIKYQIPEVCSWVNTNWSEDSLALFAFGIGHHWYNKETKILSELKGVDFPINNCFRIAPHKYLLAAEGCLYIWDGKTTKEWKRFRSKTTTCNQVFSPDGKQYYCVTSEGLYHYSDNHWKHITDKSVIDKPDFRSILPVKNTPYLLIGTQGNGILRYNTRTGTFQKLVRIPSQLQNAWSMIEDRFGQLWITSNNGIVQLNMRDLNQSFDKKTDFLLINHYRYETGLQNVEFNSRTQNKGYFLSNGNILFSSLGGPVIIKPQSNHTFNNALGNILIEKIAVNEQPTNSVRKHLQLIEGDFVQIQFTLPSFAVEHVLNFEYRIKGYRNEWTSVSNRQITLDNLPSGDFQLEIRLTSGKRALRLPIHVSQKYPNMWILYVVLTLVIVVTVILITAYFTKWAQRRKHATNSMKQQLKILELEALRSQMNPHFIFNCLNTIQFLFLSGSVDRANKYLTDFSSLMRMTLDLLRVPITTLDIELKATTLYVELEQLQFDHGFEFRLINNLKTPISQIITPTLFFQILVENAIIHGLKKTPEPAPILTIILDETQDNFIFRVCDNGPGLDSAIKEDHNSVGLSILKERFELKNEIYNWNIQFYMQELKTLENDIRTEIIITFGKILNEPIANEDPDSRRRKTES